MNIVVNVLVIAVACLAAFLVYVLAAQALRNFSPFNSRRAIPFAVAMLTFLSIVELGRGIILLLLIPYAALGITLVVLYLMCHITPRSTGRKPPSFESFCFAVKHAGCALARRIQQELDRFWPW